MAQARLLLDQQQYQQLENLKNKPAQMPPQSMGARPVTIQPQTSPHQTIDYNSLKRTMSGTQLRIDDTQQRAML